MSRSGPWLQSTPEICKNEKGVFSKVGPDSEPGPDKVTEQASAARRKQSHFAGGKGGGNGKRRNKRREGKKEGIGETKKGKERDR